MKSQAYRMAMLYDFYGDLLTPRQKEFYDMYYNDDLSLSEIAENYDITRQGVRDIIVRAERALEDIEEKTSDTTALGLHCLPCVICVSRFRN